jgi:elongation factor 1-delta
VSEIERARQQIQNSLKTNKPETEVDNTIVERIETLEQENKELRKVTDELRNLVQKLETRIKSLEVSGPKPAAPAPAAQVKQTEKKDENEDEEDDDFDPFASDDDEDEEAERLKAERVKMYAEKKSKKPALIAKSNIILDVKPWDDETDMAEMEKLVRTIEMDGLLWGNSKLVPLAYGIKKLQISCVVEDDKVGTDDLEEKITEFEDYVQSVDIAAFNKI